MSRDLLHFIAKSPSVFHAVRGVKAALAYAGFTELREEDTWQIEKGGKYVVTRDGSALVAFAVPENGGEFFRIAAAHCDSPTFKIKENPEIKDGPYVRLNVEGYGGMIMSTWMDRPLSVAGRLITRENGHLAQKLVAVDGTMLVIPSVAIHMDCQVNQNKSWNVQKDLLPLYGLSSGKTPFMDVIAASAKVKAEDILAHDLYLYSRVPGTIWGEEREFVSSPKLDDLQCAFASLEAFVAEKNRRCVTVFACFDNEEVGSNTKQGAMSTLLHDTLVRANAALGMGEEDYLRALSRSFLVSCDNAHGLHPNHPELYDAENRCRLNGGPVVKEAANQKYTTDAFSRAVFVSLCEKAGVPHQTFANRSDMAGGSTLGNLSNTQVSVHAVDIGLPQLAMHSSYETAGTRDTTWTIRALREFFSADLRITGAERVDMV